MSLENPYKGLFPYTAQDENFFFGRDKEAYDLVEMIKSNQLVVFYGESGTGKTSLINAKLFPELRRQYYFPIYIRLNYVVSKDPLKQLREIIFNELNKWDKSVPEFTDDCTLIEYAANTSIFNGLVKPILFFDQFEELFTLAPKHVDKKLLENLVTQLGDLIETRMPKFKGRFITSVGKEYANVINDISRNVIEEDNGIAETQYEQKLKAVEQTCIENILRFTVVFSLRQDFIAQLDDLRFQIPSISVNRFRIRKFEDNQALAAILKPAEAYKKEVEVKNSERFSEIVTEETAKEIICQLKRLETNKVSEVTELQTSYPAIIKNYAKKIKKQFNIKGSKLKKDNCLLNEDISVFNAEIDPTILSLYCYQLFEEAKALTSKNGKKQASSFAQIKLEQVYSSPCDQIIKNYYKVSLTNIRQRIPIENFLITPDGRRVLIYLNDFISKSKIQEKAIINLKEKTAIVRIYGEGDDREIELAHDQIARRALISKKAREANRITTYAIGFLITCIVLVALIVSVYTYYLNNLRNRNDIVKLNTKLSVQYKVNRSLVDSLIKLNDSYSTVLTTKNILVTDKDSINKKINLIQEQLNNVSNRNKSLVQQNQNWAAENTKWQTRYALQSDSLGEKINQLDNANNTKVRLQNDLEIWQSRYKSKGDSLNSLKVIMDRLQNDLGVLQTRYKLQSDSLETYINSNTGLRRQLNNSIKTVDSLQKQNKILWGQLLDLNNSSGSDTINKGALKYQQPQQQQQQN